MKNFTALILVAVVGCATPATRQESPSNGAAVRIDIGRALVRHPFAPILAQYDADIATLRRAAEDPAFRDLHADIGTSAADVERRLQSASGRLLRAPAIQPARAPGAATRRDFDGSVVASFKDASQARVARALDLRSAQLHEHEATIAFDFERAHAGQRLVLGLKLRDLHLDAATRRRYQTQLDEFDREESARVDAERNRDAGILSAYAVQLRARALADSAAMASDFTSHARIMHAMPPLQIPALQNPKLGPDAATKETIAAFGKARSNLSSRLAELQTMDDGARDVVRTEISDLVQQRDTLRKQIIASLEARAASIVAARHLGRLYTGGAPRSARDITDDVLRSYGVTAGS